METNITRTLFESKLILDIEIFKTLKTLAGVCTREELLEYIQTYLSNAEKCMKDYRAMCLYFPLNCKEHEDRP